MKIVILHLVNFIGLEIILAFEFAVVYYQPQPDLFFYSMIVREIYFAYMTLVLFYLVYCFGKNRHLGTTVYEESLI